MDYLREVKWGRLTFFLINCGSLYVQSDENTLPKVDKISKTEAQTFTIFDKLIGPLQFCI